MRRIIFLFLFFLLVVPTASATIGVWVTQGVVIAPVSSDTPAQPNVLYESGCVIFSSPCFRMWFSTANGVAYAESSDGSTWTRYSGNPVIAITGQPFANVFKTGGVYYLYGNTNGTGRGGPPIAAYTSTNGISWTLQKSDIGIGLPLFGQLRVLTINAGTWYGYFTAESANIFSEELATSTDGFNWTANPANTITAKEINNPFFLQVGSTWYAWGNVAIPGLPSACAGCPTDIARFKSIGGTPQGNSPTGPWVQDVPTVSFYRTRAEEGVGSNVGQVGDASMVSVNGNLYMYYTVNTLGSGNTGYQTSLAIASGTTFNQLVTTYEGVQNIPIPWGAFGPLWQFAPIAQDNFQRANANPIGGNWTTFDTDSSVQLVSNTAEGTTLGGTNAVFYNAISAPNDQCSQITVSSIASGGATSFAGVLLRASNSVATSYFLYYSTAPGIFLQKQINGTFTNILLSGLGPGPANGDVITGCVIGTVLSFYVNGNLIGDASDSAIASGGEGFFVNPATALTNAAINNWLGGGVQAAPTIGTGRVISQ